MFVASTTSPLLTQTLTYTSPDIAQAAFISNINTQALVTADTAANLKTEATAVAEKYKISTTTLFNLIDAESKWDPATTSPDGNDRGLVQISRIWFPSISDAEAYNPAFSLDFAASQIAKGNAYLWTSCSCVKTARYLGVQFPAISSPADLKPNASPEVGAVVILKYGQTWHMAKITKLNEASMSVVEGNYEPCKISTREISYNDPHIIGFYMED